MATETVYLGKTKHVISPNSLIASGGEGDVFDLSNGMVLKKYRQSSAVPEEKLHLLCHLRNAQALPPSALGPQEIAYNQKKIAVGYAMPKLPAHAISLKKLCTPKYQKLLNITWQAILDIFRLIHQDINHFHRTGLVVGDFNDSNLWVDGRDFDQIFWLDVDSFQIGRHPCPVAHPVFVDPYLYHVQDFAARPAFSPANDWYAFAVHLARALTGIHPYGGTHPRYKSLHDRATNKVSFFHSAVQLPTQGQDPHRLPPALKSIFKQYFEEGQRPLFPPDLLSPTVPAVARPPSTAAQFTPITPVDFKKLLGSSLELKTHRLSLTGRWQGIAYDPTTQEYSWIEGGSAGLITQKPILIGSHAYQFHLFENGIGIVDPDQKVAIILTVKESSGEIEPLTTLPLENAGANLPQLPTAAASDSGFCRLVNGVVLQGTIINGQWVEEIIGTAYRQNTSLWGDPESDLIAALHHVFGDYYLWIRWPDGSSIEVPVDHTLAAQWPQLSAADLERYFKNTPSLISL
ncbi:MAG: hypothetical protein QNJ45_20155 [Ardenticatenaceae bacterium]|nr:hypothetical protein [Ardenticatenaceae bacterium]